MRRFKTGRRLSSRSTPRRAFQAGQPAKVGTLEPRTMLSGNVSVLVTETGFLRIRGDAGDNDLSITVEQVDDPVEERPISFGRTIRSGHFALRFESQMGTTVNGVAAESFRLDLNDRYRVFRSQLVGTTNQVSNSTIVDDAFISFTGRIALDYIDIRLGAGDDRLSIDLNGHDGSLPVQNPSQTLISDGIAVRLGRGDDTVRLTNYESPDRTTVLGQGGNEDIHVDGVAGDVLVRTERGDDDIYVGSTDDVFIRSGGGGDDVEVGLTRPRPSNFINDSVDGILIGSSGTRSVSVRTDSGDDRVTATDTFARLYIETGAGDDEVAMRVSSINVGMAFLGSGEDLLSIETPKGLVPSTVLRIAARGQSGNDEFRLTGVADLLPRDDELFNPVLVYGRVLLDGGEETDRLESDGEIDDISDILVRRVEETDVVAA